MRKQEKFFHPVDRVLQKMRNTVNDLEKRVLKRTKKHTYKMDVTYRPQVKYENKNDERLAMLGQPDPVLTQHFKHHHAFNYQELMGYEADKTLFQSACIPQNVYEGDCTEAQKLEDYNDLLACRQSYQKRQKVVDEVSHPMSLYK